MINESKLGFYWEIYGEKYIADFYRGLGKLFLCYPNWYLQFVDIGFWVRNMTSEDAISLDNFIKSYCNKLESALISFGWPGSLKYLPRVLICFFLKLFISDSF